MDSFSDENIQLQSSPVDQGENQQQQQQQYQQPQQPPKQPLLTSIEVTDQNVALNLLVSFLNLAQKRGVFTIDESAKIWECISKFRT
jgi:glutathione synthase/RimK-type ligase-like ATP-grasp enzyme